MSESWRNRIVGHGDEAPDRLLANPRNWRIHPKSQQDALAGVLSEVGWVQDVIFNRRSGHIIDIAVRRWEEYTGRKATRDGALTPATNG